MVAKKAETFTVKTAGELVEGDRFRESETTKPWAQVVSVEQVDSYDSDPERRIINCQIKFEGATDEFRFAAFAKVLVEVLN